MGSFSIDLRERVERAAELRERSIKEIARLYQVSTSFIYKLQGQKQESGSVAPKPHGGGPPPVLNESKRIQLRRLVQEQPDATLQELQQRLHQATGAKPSLSTICGALQKLDLKRKKKRFFAQEQNPQEREQFRQQVQALDPQRMIFIDEMGANINLSRLYARGAGAERIEEALPRNTPSNVSTVGALAADGLLGICSLEGAFDGEAFALFIEQMVVPQLHPGDTVLMDNVSIHQSARVESAIKAAGAQLLNLPAYSPDFDPIESCWSKVKEFLRQAKARTVEALYEALGAAFKLICPEDIRGWFVHCGYNLTPG